MELRNPEKCRLVLSAMCFGGRASHIGAEGNRYTDLFEFQLQGKENKGDCKNN